MKNKLLIFLIVFALIGSAIFLIFRFWGRTTVKVTVENSKPVALGIASDSSKVTNVIPQSFPTDFPKVSGAEVEAAFENDGQPNVIWVTNMDPSEVVSFYKMELPKSGWKISSTKDIAGGTVFEVTKSDLVVQIGVGKDQERNQTVIFVGIQKAVPSP